MRCAVVGGGIVGILSALMVREKYDSVVLIEQKDELGGLLNTVEHEGAYFDYGTHIPAFNKIEQINQYMFGSKQEREDLWDHFPYLKSENYFNGKWYSQSPLIDARNLETDVYHKGLEEILSLPAPDPKKNNLGEYLLHAFGPTFKENIYDAVFQKVLNKTTDDLHRYTLILFGIHRLILLNTEAAQVLKQLPRYEGKLGFHSYTMGTTPNGYVYPNKGQGIGSWIDFLYQKLKEQQIEILTSTQVQSLQYGEKINLELSNNQKIEADNLIWTIPVPLALKLLGEKVEGIRPEFRTTTLVHFEFDRDLLKSEPYFLLCWDQKYLSYRITLYPNIAREQKRSGQYTLTVEILSDESIREDLPSLKEKVFKELVELEVISAETQVTSHKVDYLGYSFPIMTEQFTEQVEKQNKLIEEKYDRMMVLGRGAGRAFFMHELLQDAYYRIKEKLLDG